MARPRVLLTGFGPFPGVAENPSAWLVDRLGECHLRDCGELHARILPTEWRAAELTPQLYDALQPDIMIHFGLSLRAQALRIEHSAFNRTSKRADAANALPRGRRICQYGADRLDTKIPSAALASHLRAQALPAVVSRSAGSYLCNFLYYHSLQWAHHPGRSCVALFIHIPLPAHRGGPINETDLVRGAQESLNFLLTVTPEPVRPDQRQRVRAEFKDSTTTSPKD